MKGVSTVIMAGGRGTRLYPLTKDRAKPSVPFAGKYRLIDIPMSNCLHSGLSRIFILTQFNSQSLNRHVNETYHFGSVSDSSVQILAAEQSYRSTDWYQGTADAVRQNLRHMVGRQHRPEHFLILAGDHLYRMDYRRFVEHHVEAGADVTLGVLPVGAAEASRFGILRSDSDGWIRRFAEKPDSAEALEGLESTLHGDDASPRFLASMGIYVVRTGALLEMLDSEGVDFGRDIIPGNIESRPFQAYPFEGYWEDIGTIRAFFEANLGLLDTLPRFDFYDESQPIFTYPYHLPSSKVNECRVLSSKLADGAIIDRSTLRRSIVGRRARIREGTEIEESLIMGCDYYESREQMDASADAGHPYMGIGRNCRIRRAIIDKNARIGDDVYLVNESDRQEVDAEDESWFIRDGIIVVPKNAVIPTGTRV